MTGRVIARSSYAYISRSDTILDLHHSEGILEEAWVEIWLYARNRAQILRRWQRIVRLQQQQRRTDLLLLGQRQHALPETSRRWHRQPPCGLDRYVRTNTPDTMRSWRPPPRWRRCWCICSQSMRPNNRRHPTLCGGRDGEEETTREFPSSSSFTIGTK